MKTHPLCNQGATGSNPVAGTIFQRLSAIMARPARKNAEQSGISRHINGTIFGTVLFTLIGAGIGGAPLAFPAPAQAMGNAVVQCQGARAIDGDTLRCRNLGLVRLLSIDAPEMAGHCRKGRVCTPGDGPASKRGLAQLIGKKAVTCVATAHDHYGRLLARCSAGGVDLSCAMVARGLAVERYGRLSCR